MATDPRGLRGDAPLLDAWLRFHERPSTPFTIPGHKHRRDLVGDVVAGDVPLYAGLDTMRLSRGLLADAEARAAQLWGADVARLSVGGATHANQAVALALGGDGGRVVVSRTLHRSLLIGLVLAGLDPVWVRPEVDPATALPLGVAPATVERALAEHPDCRAVFVGDPSYVGTVGDVAGLAEVAHAHGIPLVVDGAWAAHFGFHPDLPPHALELGADVLITSAHKTLPAWSQAALVLARTERIDPARLDAGVEATATTSPAGAILASTDAARALLARDGESLLGPAITAVRAARERLRGVQGLDVLDGPRVDPLKLTLCLHRTGADGIAVEQDLLAAGLPVEAAERNLLVAVVTLADDLRSVGALTEALVEAVERHRGAPRDVVGPAAYAVEPVPAVPPRQAFFADVDVVPIGAAVGRISAELVAPYPPGVPVLAPGEQVTAHAVEVLRRAQAAGVRIAYAADSTLSRLRVVRTPPPGPPGRFRGTRAAPRSRIRDAVDMTDLSGPPFRADHVGSLLRPADLLEARSKHAAGDIDDDELRGIEDEAIRDVVAMQAGVGLRTATDGEFRRASWHMDFIYAIDGITKVTDQNIVVHFKNEDGSIDFTPAGLHVDGPLRIDEPIFGRDFAFLQSVVREGRTAKLTIPSPSMVHYRGGAAAIDPTVYPDEDQFWEALSAAYRQQVHGIAAQGCTYLQFDDTSLAYLNDPAQRAEIAAQGRDAEHLHERYIRQINKALAGRPDGLTVTTHMCRGNFRSSWVAEGGYDFVAESLFGGLDVDGFFLEYDDARSGGFEPLRFVPPGKRVVLGLVTTKRPELERKDDLKRRIDEASRFVPLDQLALSGQCGFSSTVEGNALTRDQQIAKLALIVETAEEVWG